MMPQIDWPAWVAVLSTVVLAGITWLYAKTLADQSQTIVDEGRRREITRRRRMAVSLRDLAAEIQIELHGSREYTRVTGQPNG